MLLSLVQKEVIVRLKVEQILHQIFVYSTDDEGRIRAEEGKPLRIFAVKFLQSRQKSKID